MLVNNAGTIAVGPIETMTLADFDEAMRTHFWGPVYTTMAVLPYLRRSGGGRIVNISSIGGKIATPHLVPRYTAVADGGHRSGPSAAREYGGSLGALGDTLTVNGNLNKLLVGGAAFTLVELLVVIGIIAVLVGMLLARATIRPSGSS